MSETENTENIGFADLGLRPELLDALMELGYEEPTPIQRESIPRLLEGRDLLWGIWYFVADVAKFWGKKGS